MFAKSRHTCLLNPKNGIKLCQFRYVYAHGIKDKKYRSVDANVYEVFLKEMDGFSNKLGPDGQPLFVDASGRHWGGIFLFSTGDLEQILQSYNMRHYNLVDQICPGCLADRSLRPFTNLQEDAEWKETENMLNKVFVREKNVRTNGTCN